MRRPVVLFGAYGTFGSIVARELAGHGVPLVLAGRSAAQAAAAAAALGEGHRGRALDLRDAAALRDALDGAAAAVNCASSEEALLAACFDAGCHYVDMSDSRDLARRVRSWGAAFRERRLVAAYGCSSLPGISGALGVFAREGRRPDPVAARVVLLVGNDNRKGPAAARSLLGGAGRPIATSSGPRTAFAPAGRAPLPPPFGRRRVREFDGPEHDLLPAQLGVGRTAVQVGFESGLVDRGLGVLACLPATLRRRLAGPLARAGSVLARWGSSGGVVQTELTWADGVVQRAALVAERDGQRMAALPCVLAVRAILDRATGRGALTAYELLGARALVGALESAGYVLVRGVARAADGTSPGPPSARSREGSTAPSTASTTSAP